MPAAAKRTVDASSELIAIYQCLCDETRLRILNLLAHVDQLCVCHFQDLLGRSQVQISKHLAYLKSRGLVEAAKHANWMIYRLPARRSPELDSNLRCLQDCVQTHPVFKKDLAQLATLRPKLGWLIETDCCGGSDAGHKRKSSRKTGNSVRRFAK